MKTSVLTVYCPHCSAPKDLVIANGVEPGDTKGAKIVQCSSGCGREFTLFYTVMFKIQVSPAIERPVMPKAL